MKPKKVLLIDPIYNSGDVPPNVSLGQIEHQLQQVGIDIKVMDFVQPECEKNDLHFFQQKEQDFYNKIVLNAHDVDIIYVTSGHGNALKPYPQYPRIVKIAKILKQNYPNKPIVVGGALINLYKRVYKLPDEQIKGLYIDIILDGNELNLLNLFDVNKKHQNSYSTCKWENWDMKKYPDFRSVLYHVGCAYKCDFCFEGKIFDKNTNIETPDAFLKTIRHARECDGINKFVIEDSTFMSYPDFDYLVHCIKEMNIKFSIYARISEVLAKPQKVQQLKDAGCSAFIVGIETLNDDILKKQHKGLVTQQTRRALDIIKGVGIEIQGCFMLGFPEDSVDNMYRTVDFAINENLNGYRWHIYQPNFASIDNKFYSQTSIQASDHILSQINVPDHCLIDNLAYNPEICLMDEHFLPRARKTLLPSDIRLQHLGYQGRFNYADVLSAVNRLPIMMELNEERLYHDLFRCKQK